LILSSVTNCFESNLNTHGIALQRVSTTVVSWKETIQSSNEPVTLPGVDYFGIDYIAAGCGTVEEVEEEPDSWRQRVVDTQDRREHIIDVLLQSALSTQVRRKEYYSIRLLHLIIRRHA